MDYLHSTSQGYLNSRSYPYHPLFHFFNSENSLSKLKDEKSPSITFSIGLELSLFEIETAGIYSSKNGGVLNTL